MPGNEAARVRAIRVFFADVGKENAGRAVRLEPPMTYPLVKAAWARSLEYFVPNGDSAVGGAAGGQSGGRGRGSRAAAGQLGRGGPAPGGSSSARAGQPGPGARAASAGGAMRLNRAGAMLQGIPVCYPFNSPAGCTRSRNPQNSATCVNNGNHFVHACNYWDMASGSFCLQLHSRVGNH